MFVFNADQQLYVVVGPYMQQTMYTPPAEPTPPGITVFKPGEVRMYAVHRVDLLPVQIQNGVHAGWLQAAQALVVSAHTHIPGNWDDIVERLAKLENLQVLEALATYQADMYAARAAVDTCIYCDRPQAEHVEPNSKCLFGPTHFISIASAFKAVKENPGLLATR